MVRRLLIVVPVVVLTLIVVSMFLPARQMNIESIGRLSFETRVTLSIGSEATYASPDVVTNSPSADSGGWTNPTNAYADGGGYASVTSGTPSASHTYSGYGFSLSDEQITQVRVRYDASNVQYSTTTANSFPTSDQEINGTWTVTPASPTTRYDKIDDTSTDTDYITCTALAGGSGYTYYGFTTFSVPSSATITNLTVYYRARQASASSISFRSAGAVAFAASGNVIPALPTGWQVNDLFICMIASRDNVNSTMPSGWTAIDSGTNNGTGLRTTSFYRRAQSGDTNPTVTHSGGSQICAGIVAYSGVITTGSPIDVVGATSVNTPASTTITFHSSGITTTTNNDLVVELGGTSNRATCSNYTGTPTPTEEVDGPNRNNYPEVIIADFIQATAGGTGARSATLNTARTSNGKLVSFKPQPPAQVASAIKVGGTLYGATDPGVNTTASFTTYSYAFTNNPKTDSAWTVADINGTGANPLQEIGVYTNNTTPNVSVSGLYAVVNYTGYNQIRVDVSWDGGISWSSKQTTTLTGSEVTYWYDVTSATTWTPAKLDNANFRVRVDAYTVGIASEVRLDWIPVEVNYSLAPTCWLSGWSKRVKLTIDRNDITAPLSDFPVMVYLSTSSGRGSDNVACVFDELQSNANRFKIAVTTSECTELYVEIEKWDQASQKAWLWVRVPNITNSADTVLHLYYDRDHADNTAYVGDTNSTPAEMVWDGNFKMVQHLGEDSTVVHDSTANNNDETNPPPEPPSPGYYRAIYTGSGRINGCYSFSDNGTNATRLQMAHSSSLDITDNITVEAFVYLNDKTNGKLIVKDDPLDVGGPGCYNLQQENSNVELMLDLGGSWVRASYSTYNAGEWIYVVGTYDRQTIRLYLNGTQVATNPQTTAISSRTVNLALGNRAEDVGTSYDLHGLLDEARVSNTARSAAWIRASYESGRDDLIDFGTEETRPVDISNTPPSKDFSTVVDGTTYWSNGSAPTFPLDDSECFFTLTNNSSGAVDITIKATDFIGGDNWTLDSSPGVNIVTLKAGKSGDEVGNMLTLTTSEQPFISGLGASQSKKWEIMLETGTFTDEVEKTSTITLTATYS